MRMKVVAMKKKSMLSVGLLGAVLAGGAPAQLRVALAADSGQAPRSPVVSFAPVPKHRAVPKTALPPSARRFYESAWGIDIVGVKSAESGSMLRFSYRVLDASKAQ